MKQDVYPLHNPWFWPDFPYFQYLPMIFRQYEAKRLKYLILHIPSPTPNPPQQKYLLRECFILRLQMIGMLISAGILNSK